MATVTYHVYRCEGVRGEYVPLGQSGTVATCSTASGGTKGWVALQYVEPFDPSQLDSAELGNAFGAGFLIMSTGLLASFGIRIIIKAVKDIF